MLSCLPDALGRGGDAVLFESYPGDSALDRPGVLCLGAVLFPEERLKGDEFPYPGKDVDILQVIFG